MAETPASFVEIRHPEITGTATCPESALEHWRSAGWERVQPHDTPAQADDIQLVEHASSE